MSEQATTEKSEQPQVVNEVIATSPTVDLTPQQTLELLMIWRGKVEEEKATYKNKREEVYSVYKRQKEMYDKWLSGPLGKMKKFDKLISGRDKVILEIDKEINKIKQSIPTSNDGPVQTNKISGETV